MPARSRLTALDTHLPDDPFDAILKPPADETHEQKLLRLEREAEAKRVSQAIDESIKQEKLQFKKRRAMRLLLLGQSESGKSTTLRQFQRLYTPSAFREERILWRAVIQLNIVRSVRTILDAISTPAPRSRSISSHYPHSITSHSPKHVSVSRGRRTMQEDAARGRHNNHHYHLGSSPPPPLPSSPRFDHSMIASGSGRRLEDMPMDDDSDEEPSSHLPEELEALRMRLLPIRHIESLLIAKLVPPNEDEAIHYGKSRDGSANVTEIGSLWTNEEVFVRPGRSWKGVMVNNAKMRARASMESRGCVGNLEDSYLDALEAPDEPQEVLNGCRKDMVLLWQDPLVRDILKRKKVRLEDLPGFFLNDIERVTSLQYLPSDDDVLKARLKTIGVTEYKFSIEGAGREAGSEWRIIDVGGSRSQRPTWVPFFDSVDAIIFLAPISGFDQVLPEDRTVNRLEDSVLLWKALCTNKLLQDVDLVLFLNKCDLLEAKLKSGTRLAKYVRSYGDRGNDVGTVSSYLRSKFGAILREHSPKPRKFYAFCTSVTDTTTTSGIIASVRDRIARQSLSRSGVL